MLPAGYDTESAALEIARYCYDRARQSVEDARPTLELLYDKYPMVLVSNFYGNVETVLADFDLRKYFKSIVESAVVGVRKPDPRIFSLGVEALGLQPENVLVVGDSYAKDIVPAESIGCKVAWLKGKGWTDKDDAVLQQVKDEKLWQSGKIKEFYTEITDILREYMDRRFGINAMELTSEQILAFVRKNPEMEEVRQLLRQMLELSDLVKFAKFIPLEDENQRSMSDAFVFVEKTAPADAPAAEDASEDGQNANEQNKEDKK